MIFQCKPVANTILPASGPEPFYSIIRPFFGSLRANILLMLVVYVY